MKYIVRFDFPDLVSPYYVGRGSYCVNHEQYLVLVTLPEDAKRYSSFARAKAAIEKMLEEMRYANLCTDYTICGIEGDGKYLIFDDLVEGK